MGQRRHRQLFLLEGRLPARLAQPLARHCRVSDSQGRTARTHLRRIHLGNPRARSSSADRGCRADCANQKGARIEKFPLSRESTGVDQIAKADIEIKPLGPSPAIRTMLSELLIEAVANGGSVSFMD